MCVECCIVNFFCKTSFFVLFLGRNIAHPCVIFYFDVMASEDDDDDYAGFDEFYTNKCIVAYPMREWSSVNFM